MPKYTNRLEGKRVIVLGGSSGIGFCAAEASLEYGAHVTIASSSLEKVNGAIERLKKTSSNVIGYALDLSDDAATKKFFSEKVKEPFDHLIVTSGGGLHLSDKWGDFELEQAKKLFDIRFWGSVNAARYSQDKIRPGGSITFTIGTVQIKPAKGWALMSGIAGSTESFTRGLAVELGDRNIRVNTVSPGAVDTELWPQDNKQAMFDKFKNFTLLKRIASPEEIAEAYLYCMRSTYTTGQTILVDAGQVLV